MFRWQFQHISSVLTDALREQIRKQNLGYTFCFSFSKLSKPLLRTDEHFTRKSYDSFYLSFFSLMSCQSRLSICFHHKSVVAWVAICIIAPLIQIIIFAISYFPTWYFVFVTTTWSWFVSFRCVDSSSCPFGSFFYCDLERRLRSSVDPWYDDLWYYRNFGESLILRYIWNMANTCPRKR